jgi:hypothetical protein
MKNFNEEIDVDILDINKIEDGVIYCTVNESIIAFQVMTQIDPNQKGEQDETY